MTHVDAYIIQNENSLKDLCRKLYRGHDDYNDLFQEFYIKMVEMSPERIAKWDLKLLCRTTIYCLYLHRFRKSSPLYHERYCELSDYMAIKEDAPYTKDIQDFIEAELSRPHGFAPVMVFVQSLEEPLRSIERKTGINIAALSRYRKEGQTKLKSICS